jgi:hypothetical protein
MAPRLEVRLGWFEVCAVWVLSAWAIFSGSLTHSNVKAHNRAVDTGLNLRLASEDQMIALSYSVIVLIASLELMQSKRSARTATRKREAN